MSGNTPGAEPQMDSSNDDAINTAIEKTIDLIDGDLLEAKPEISDFIKVAVPVVMSMQIFEKLEIEELIAKEINEAGYSNLIYAEKAVEIIDDYSPQNKFLRTLMIIRFLEQEAWTLEGTEALIGSVLILCETEPDLVSYIDGKLGKNGLNPSEVRNTIFHKAKHELAYQIRGLTHQKELLESEIRGGIDNLKGAFDGFEYRFINNGVKDLTDLSIELDAIFNGFEASKNHMHEGFRRLQFINPFLRDMTALSRRLSNLPGEQK